MEAIAGEIRGRTSFGKVLTIGAIPAALDAFVDVAGGSRWEEVGPVADPVAAATDIRSFYEEAAVALAEHTPAARQAEAWFFATPKQPRSCSARNGR